MTYNFGLMSLAMAKDGWLRGDEVEIVTAALSLPRLEWPDTTVIDFEAGLLRLSQAPVADIGFFELTYEAARLADCFFYDPKNDGVYTVTPEQAACLQAMGQFAVFRDSAADVWQAFQAA